MSMHDEGTKSQRDEGYRAFLNIQVVKTVMLP